MRAAVVLFIQTDYTAVDPAGLQRAAAARSGPQPRSLKILCIGTGRDGTQSGCAIWFSTFLPAPIVKVIHEYCCREIYQALCDFSETGDNRGDDALKRMIDE